MAVSLPKTLSPVAPVIHSTMSSRVQLESQFQTLLFLLSHSYRLLTGRRLHTAHQFNDGCFCADVSGDPIPSQIVNSVSSLIRESGAIRLYHAKRTELIAYFDALRFDDKVSLLRHVNVDEVLVAVIGSYLDIVYQPVDPQLFRDFAYDLEAVDDGFYVRIPTLLAKGKLTPWVGPSTQHTLMRGFANWSRCCHSNSISELNRLIEDDGVPEINGHCREFAEKELDAIVKKLIDGFPANRLITVAGASCCGKTTFSRLLREAFTNRGFDNIVISQDDYYRKRSDIPVTSDGLKDFECIEAFDVSLLGDRLSRLLRGEEVPRHRYSFVSGLNWDDETNLKLGSNGFLIFEGIHAINPQFLKAIGAEKAVKVYVGPMTPLNIDTEHCFPPNDLRLIRRLIRDAKSRGYPARATVRQWTSVRIGEERNILPFVETADIYFNSALVYELPVLSSLGVPLLIGAKQLLEDEIECSPEAFEVTAEVERLLGLVSWLKMISLAELPSTAWVREFL